MSSAWRFGGALAVAIFAGCGSGDTREVSLRPPPAAEDPVASLPLCQTGTPPGCESPRLSRASRAAPSTPASADELFDWAERTYPQYFPSHRQTLEYAEYQYRFYPESGNYAGVAASSVFAMGPVTGGALTNLGDVAAFTCQAFPYRCNLLSAVGGSTIELASSGVLDLPGADVFIQADGGAIFKLPPGQPSGTSFVVPFTAKPLDFRLAIYRNGQEVYGATLTITPATSGAMLGHPAETYFRASLKLADEALVAARERGTATSVAEAEKRRGDLAAWVQLITDLRSGQSVELAHTPEGQPVFASAADLVLLDSAIIDFDKRAAQALGVAALAALRAPPLLADPSIDYGRFVRQMNTVEQIKLGGLAAAEAWGFAGVSLGIAGAILGSAALSTVATPILVVGMGTALSVNVVSGLWKAYHADPNFAYREEVVAVVDILLQQILRLDEIIWPALIKARAVLHKGPITRLDASLLLGARPLASWLTSETFTLAFQGMLFRTRDVDAPAIPQQPPFPGYYLYRAVSAFGPRQSCSSTCDGPVCNVITSVSYMRSVVQGGPPDRSYRVLDWYSCTMNFTLRGEVFGSGASSAYGEFYYCQLGLTCGE